jgi:hypothetical protein
LISQSEEIAQRDAFENVLLSGIFEVDKGKGKGHPITCHQGLRGGIEV